ncbi:MAG TPA: GNAT family N-acetyltransferase [Phototrophicaceae bacterium]|jgi:GNAT superfamily N-acetyltransferase|nr:GNAT family N-acetyltransferase [Phototrophicaceae bacterium]
MTFHLKLAVPDNHPALHAILVICGEHMHRTQGLSHWHPYRTFDDFMRLVDPQHFYAIYDDTYLIGTFHLTTSPRPYYDITKWANPAARAIYFGGFGILPHFQGKGAGKWSIQQADHLAVTEGYEVFRFDCVANNAPLLDFYDRLGYIRRGGLDFKNGAINPVMCYERSLV